MSRRNLALLLCMVMIFGMAEISPAQGQGDLILKGSFSVAYPGYDDVPLVVALIDAGPYFGSAPLSLPGPKNQVAANVSGIASRGSYRLTLPAQPPAVQPFDVTGSGAPSSLYMFDVRLMSDVSERGFMVENEDNIASSLRITIEFRVAGGQLIVFAADNTAQFPTDSGADGTLFTADDARVPLPAGWSLIDLEAMPFAVSPLTGETELDLITTAMGDVVDYTDLEACNVLIPALLDRVERTYPFTTLYNLDWPALRAELLPLADAAQSRGDCERIIRRFGNAIPDGHVGWFLPTLQREQAGSLGMILAPLGSGEVAVETLRTSGPAELAGIQRGAIISTWNGRPILEAAATVTLTGSNGSTPHTRLRIALGDLTRGTLGSKVEVTFVNPSQNVTQTVTLTRDRPARVSGRPTTPDGVLDSGIGYVRILQFDGLDTLRDFDRTIDSFIEQNVPAVIIDVRGNPGGFSQISDAMASRFFDDPFVVGRQISFDDRIVFRMEVAPRPGKAIYHGAVAVLVDWQTSSSGDLFAYTLQSSGRAVIVGETPSGGLAGTVSGGQYYLPDGGFIQVPTGSLIDADGAIIVEGTGVIPDVEVPITVESLLSPDDGVLAAAIQMLLEAVPAK